MSSRPGACTHLARSPPEHFLYFAELLRLRTEIPLHDSEAPISDAARPRGRARADDISRRERTRADAAAEMLGGISVWDDKADDDGALPYPGDRRNEHRNGAFGARLQHDPQHQSTSETELRSGVVSVVTGAAPRRGTDVSTQPGERRQPPASKASMAQLFRRSLNRDRTLRSPICRHRGKSR